MSITAREQKTVQHYNRNFTLPNSSRTLGMSARDYPELCIPNKIVEKNLTTEDKILIGAFLECSLDEIWEHNWILIKHFCSIKRLIFYSNSNHDQKIEDIIILSTYPEYEKSVREFINFLKTNNLI
jgi:hypothetical protein